MSDNNNKPDSKKKVFVAMGNISDEMAENNGLSKAENGSLSYVIKNLTEHKQNKAPRFALTEDPTPSEHYMGLFKSKRRLLPDVVLKQIRIQNHLIASILRARANMMSMHGKVRKDRFDIGVEVSIRPEFISVIKSEQMGKIKERISKFEQLLVNCGHTEGIADNERMGLSDFLSLQTSNGLTFGRFATEIVYVDNESGSPSLKDAAQKFHRFRPVDVGTIYNSVRKGESAASLRQQSVKLLQNITGCTIDIDVLEKDEYAYVQVIEGRPVQAFSPDELVVYNLYPSTDVEHHGYPVSPMDTCISSITTHLSIDIYNKLYFQNGRAAKGMLVVNSDDIDQSGVDDIKQQFNASINSVNNSFRVPIFGISKDDSVNWVGMPTMSGDGEFQFLYDSVSRNILSTFNMSPDELPGYGHLSRGTNQATLSESNNEFKLTAARDTGLRPLVLKFQSFLNEKIFPIMDPELAQLCTIQLAGIDAQNKDQEALRIQQDSQLHMTYDEIMGVVEKDPIGDHMAGGVPFNNTYNIVADKTIEVGQFGGHFLNDPSSYVDPMLKYRRDPFFFQNLQMLAQFNPNSVAAYYKTKSYTFEILKMLAKDYLDEEGE